MKEGWEIKTLGEVCEITNGLWTGKKPPFIEVGVIRNTNFSADGFINEKDIAIISVEEKQFRSRKLIKGDIILEKSGGGPKQPVGRVALFDKDRGDFSFSNFTSAIRIIDKNMLNFNFLHRFLYYVYILGHTESMQRQSTGIRNLQLNEYKLIEIPIPPLTEQKRIVSILDKAFAAIDKAKANAEKSLSNAKELFESYLYHSMSNDKWKTVKLQDICVKVEYGSSAKSLKEGKVPVLRMGNIQGGKFDWSDLVYTNNEEEISKYILNYNDVLFNRTNSPELVGKTAIYKGEVPAIFAGYLIRIHRKEELIDADFLNYHLNSTIAINYGKTVMSASINQANINGTKLKSYPIPLPSIDEQINIVSKLDKLQKETQSLESIYSKKINNLAELKKSILHKAFNGDM